MAISSKKFTVQEQQQLELCKHYEEEARKKGLNILCVLSGMGGYFVEELAQDEDCDNMYLPWTQYSGMFSSEEDAGRALIDEVVNGGFYAALEER